MSDLIGYIFELILSNRLLRFLLCGGAIAATVVFAGLASSSSWIFIGTMAAIWAVFEIVDVFADRFKRK